MRRSDLLKLTDMKVSAFNNLGGRDLLPFRARAGASSWGDYSAEDAYRLALMVKLTDSGWSQIAAANVVRAHFNRLKRVAKVSAPDKRPWLFGTIWVSSKGGSRLKRRPIIARQGELDAVIAAQLRAEVEGIDRLAVIDATEVLRQLRDRAADHDVRSADLEALAQMLGALA
jgi:hypothetical protein